MQKLIFCLCACFLGLSLQAQVSMKDSSINLNMMHITYRPLVPLGDLAERYGLLNSLGFEVSHKFASNWIVDAGVNVIADGDVKVSESFDVLSELRINGGLVVNDAGTPTSVRQRAGGWMAPLSIGRVFPVGGNPNSGLYAKIGTQFFQHNIRFQIDEGPVSALNQGRQSAYDLRTNGLGIRQEVGYLFLSNDGYVNFSIGLDFSQNFTQNRRSFNILTGGPITENRVDMLAGLRVSWIFLVYKKAPGVYYY